MPRKAYIADLKSAAESLSIPNISNVKQGSDDGEFKFECVVEDTTFTISALIPDVSEYPSYHSYMLFTDDAPASVAGNLEAIAEAASRKPLANLLQSVSKRLSTDRDGDHKMIDSQLSDGEDDEDEEEDYEEEEDEYDYFADEDAPRSMQPASAAEDAVSAGSVNPTPAFRRRYRADLRAAKDAGFRVGVLGSLKEGGACFVSVSCRISKFGVPTEAMQAWHVKPSEYFVVVFQFPHGYKSTDDLQSLPDYSVSQNLAARVGVCNHYKPSLREAIRVFTVLNKEDEMRKAAEESQGLTQSNADDKQRLRSCFISRPLNELFNRFWKLLSLRISKAMTWKGAEMFFNDSQGASHVANGTSVFVDQKYREVDGMAAKYPKLVNDDHLTETSTEYSLPLLGMQFAVRHFVRCTEFCLVCFDKLPEDVQAIKPYVCDKELCLFQYISLGFGPSLEHEILTQPKVVDLLVSFCYVRAANYKLVDFPTGLNIVVPPSRAYASDYPATQGTQPASTPGPEIKARYNEATDELMFPNQNEPCPLRVGDWVVICDVKGRHCRVAEVVLWPTLKLGKPVMLNSPKTHSYDPSTKSTADEEEKNPPTPSNEFLDAVVIKYSQDFDQLRESSRRAAICAMLDLLPPISELQHYLKRHSMNSLSSWVDRIPAGVLALLRWIVATNRACILQVEEKSESSDTVWGMPGWTQFRFAMGAPDKELKFVQAVNATKTRLKLKYETLFAWHGSPLYNWHSIIRQGLRFDYTAHGRAFGNGVYHSQDLNTSMGYSQIYGYGTGHWQSSELRASQAVALNEIVNAPKEYVSSSPHLVVQHLDWIQTRYLFVKAGNSVCGLISRTSDRETETQPQPAKFIEQDPTRTCRGVGEIVIPASAIARSRRDGRVQSASPKRRKTSRGKSASDPIILDEYDDDDTSSVATLEEDRAIIEEEEDDDVAGNTLALTPNSTKGKIMALFSKLGKSKSKSDFVPGSLDYSKLPMLKEPTYANPATTRRLMKDFQMLVKTQSEASDLADLGWYIDPDRVENMYQWIVELHSFDPTLGLAEDMKVKGLKSIVLELRFPAQYPMSPPFVRVIQPRFLCFLQGGGGHVTAGGAMCMELLTNNGWSAVLSIESLLLQVRTAITSTDPRPARLDTRSHSVAYGVGEAVEAYIRACNMHGWKMPEGFREFALGGTLV